MGFGERCRYWIQGCLNSSRALIFLNGSPTKEFDIRWGIRQGDRLSPLLFIIEMEGLNIAMKAACGRGIFKGIKIPNSDLTLSHPFYADDTLFMGDWSEDNIKNLARILRCFHVSSGLKVNFKKSRVFGIWVDPQEVLYLASPLGCKPAKLLFTYLGVLVRANMKLKKHWKPVIENFQLRLNSWKSKKLSFRGRLTLTKAVLGSLPTFYFSLFLAPTCILKTLEKIRRRFLWGGSENQGRSTGFRGKM
ncbi:uncharacterized protein LOC111921539 [Lactuca sativa]|uniref:uncharacterized protein LOC111921539 n=1 Tax=Lactuca sativa TaxID=4236 RepID=UPI000CD7FF2D|nr:uncharacterized protein LOC111921539 [Lactuca sativa]